MSLIKATYGITIAGFDENTKKLEKYYSKEEMDQTLKSRREFIGDEGCLEWVRRYKKLTLRTGSSWQ